MLPSGWLPPSWHAYAFVHISWEIHPTHTLNLAIYGTMFLPSCGERRSPLCSPRTNRSTPLLLSFSALYSFSLSLLPSPSFLLQHARWVPLPPPAPSRVHSSQFALQPLLYNLSLLHQVQSEVGTLILDAFPLLSLPWFSLSSTFLFFQPPIQGPSS